jgi:outer membrane protein OmpA-like peptidoglycan-associated protein
MSDGLTRITLEKAISSHERNLSGKAADASYPSRPRFTVYLGEGAVFSFGRFELQPGVETQLRRLGELLKASEKKEIVISAHVDQLGGHEKKDLSSERRPKTIANWLTKTGSLEQKKRQILGEDDRFLSKKN